MANSILDTADYFKTFPEATNRAAQLAINTVANRSGLKLARTEILNEIAFPRDYLTTDRLRVSQNATASNLEAVILARQRATSLARFVQGSTATGSRAKLGVTVKVKKGKTVHLKQSWLVNLKNNNLGLAVRVKPGEKIDNKHGKTVWLVPDSVALLYGPSVDQVFRDVAEKIAGPVGELTQTEFHRQFQRIK